MNRELSSRLKGLYPKVKIYNASGVVQKVEFNSKVYTFPPGKATEIEGQDDVERDMFGRDIPGGASVPNPNATTEMIADWVLGPENKGKGLCLWRGDATDRSEAEEARRAYVRANITAAKQIEARWLQRVLDARAAGQVTPAMPPHVEEAQDFLLKNRGMSGGSTKRFVVTLDGRSFDKLAQAQKHITLRYPNKAKETEKHIEDTNILEDSPLGPEDNPVEVVADAS